MIGLSAAAVSLTTTVMAGVGRIAKVALSLGRNPNMNTAHLLEVALATHTVPARLLIMEVVGDGRIAKHVSSAALLLRQKNVVEAQALTFLILHRPLVRDSAHLLFPAPQVTVADVILSLALALGSKLFKQLAQMLRFLPAL